MEYRIERDSVGEMKVPVNAYYGIHSQRAKENFDITGRRINSKLIVSFAYVKKAAAIVNWQDEKLSTEYKDAICQACDEIISGNLHDNFIVDPFQGGAGTSTNMNANEVIANRANEILGYKLGSNKVHPNDHLNMSQSTNDAYPTAARLATLSMIKELLEDLDNLIESLSKKQKEFDLIIKMGRTEMQDAIPMRLGQEFGAYKEALKRDSERIRFAIEDLSVINMGASAIGTSLNVSQYYRKNIVPCLRELTGLDLIKALNLIDATSNADILTELSSSLKILAINLSKISNDLRLLSSGPRTMIGDINLPSKQNGSSIMPGKVNPVIPELINQIAFRVIGNDTTVNYCIEGGQLQLNAFLPMAFHSIFESIQILNNGMKTLSVNCIDGISANTDKMREDIEKSTGIVTALVPIIGYEKSAQIAKKALNTGKGILEIVREDKIMSNDEIDKLLEPMSMTE